MMEWKKEIVQVIFMFVKPSLTQGLNSLLRESLKKGFEI